MAGSATSELALRVATERDVALILAFIRELADYEKLLQEVVTTEHGLREHLFGERPAAEVVIAEWAGEPAGFALYFRTFSTFVGRPGLYLEDLYVRPALRGKGVGKRLLAYLAHTAKRLGYGRVEWAVLNWNQPAIEFYRSVGARAQDDWIVNRLTGDALDALAAHYERA